MEIKNIKNKIREILWIHSPFIILVIIWVSIGMFFDFVSYYNCINESRYEAYAEGAQGVDSLPTPKGMNGYQN